MTTHTPGPTTRVFMSFSAAPGSFGATVYTRLFRELRTDAVYLPRPAPDDARDLVGAIRACSLNGASISSPHKAAVIPWLDEVEELAQQCGSVNTVVRSPDGALCGYCTDADGVSGALGNMRFTSAVIYGSGGVVGPVIHGLRRCKVEQIAIVGRNQAAIEEQAARYGVEPGWDGGSADLTVNATPAGDHTDIPADLKSLLSRSSVLLDLPLALGTRPLWVLAERDGVTVIPGSKMYTHQVRRQASIYLGREVTMGQITRALKPLLQPTGQSNP